MGPGIQHNNDPDFRNRQRSSKGCFTRVSCELLLICDISIISAAETVVVVVVVVVRVACVVVF